MVEDHKTRKHFRVESTNEEIIKIAFKQPELKKLESRIEVKDISLRGLGLKVPLGVRALKEGMIIEDIEIRLPVAGRCFFSGKIVYKRLGHCGIEFLDGDPLERRKLEAFTSLKEKERKKD